MTGEYGMRLLKLGGRAIAVKYDGMWLYVDIEEGTVEEMQDLEDVLRRHFGDSYVGHFEWSNYVLVKLDGGKTLRLGP